MTISRETVYAALFAKLQTVPNIAFYSRRMKHLSDVASSQFPAAFQVQSAEDIVHTANMPAIYAFKPEWWIYTMDQSRDGIPSTPLNGLIDAIEAALNPDWAGVLTQTLGLQVYRAYVAGPIEIFEGVEDGRAMAIIPISITIAGVTP